MKNLLLFASFFISGMLYSQDKMLKVDIHIAHGMSFENLLIENGSNPLIKSELGFRSLPFIELRHSKMIGDKFAFGIGLFAHQTRQDFSVDLISINFEMPAAATSNFQIEHKSYRFTNFRTGLSASANYQLGSWRLGASLGPSFGWFTHNHDGTYINESRWITSHPNGVHWGSSRIERVMSEKRFVFDWYYSFVLSYKVHTRAHVNLGLFGFGRPLTPRGLNKQYQLAMTTDLASNSGGMIFDNDIEVVQPNHFWSVGVTIDVWNSRQP